MKSTLLQIAPDGAAAAFVTVDPVPPDARPRGHAGPSRRRVLALCGTAALGVALAGGIAGCGFALRQAPVFAFRTLSMPGNSAFVNYLRRNIAAAGTVELLPPARTNAADAVLEILGENRERVVLSTNAAGEVRELQLRLRVRYRLHTPAGKDLQLDEIAQQRDLSYNETNALAKEGEAELLFRDMQNDIAQQMLRRLAAVKEL
jgi:LPS-assembly lipoprotein